MWWLSLVKQLKLGTTREGKKATQKDLELPHLTIISYTYEAKTPHEGNTQVTHPHEQADKGLSQTAAPLNITGMFNFKVKGKSTFSKTVIEKLLPGSAYSDIVGDCFHKKEKTWSSCQLKCALGKQKFNFNAASYSILTVYWQHWWYPFWSTSLWITFLGTRWQRLCESKSVTVYWGNPITFIISQLTNQAVLRINKSFFQSATPHFLVQMLPSIITHLKQGSF